MICPVCNGPMKPLMVSWFCPNDCDRKPAPQPKGPFSYDVPDYSGIYKAPYRNAYIPTTVQSQWPKNNLHLNCPYDSCGGADRTGGSPARTNSSGVTEYDCRCKTCGKTWTVTI